MIILLCLRIDQTAGDYASSQSLGDVWWLIFCPASVSPSKRVPLKLCYLQLMTIIFFHFVSMHNWNENIFILWLASYDFSGISVFFCFRKRSGFEASERIRQERKREKVDIWDKWIVFISRGVLKRSHTLWINLPTPEKKHNDVAKM